jgi:hypothetical protein
MMEREVLHIQQLAEVMGRTVPAIRSAMQSRNKCEWMPPHFKQGRRNCWRPETVRIFLRDYEAGKHKARKPGRPRKSPQPLGQVVR